MIKININGTLIPIAKMKGLEDRKPLKGMINAITRVLDSIQINTDTEASLSNKKRRARELLDGLSEHYGFVLLPGLDIILDSYLPKQEIDYQKLNQMVPKVVDISRMSESQVSDIGKVLEDRLSLLRDMKTPEDAGANKSDIISFMKSQETEDPLGIIVAADLENVNDEDSQKLDLSTILACTKHLRSFENEDAIMYSTYLKLEEKRILKRVQMEIEATRTVENSETIDRILAEIEEMKIGTGTSEEEKNLSIMQYMMAIRNERDVERYVKEFAKRDIKIRRYVLDQKIPYATEISRYFSARIASLGQVTQIGNTPRNSKVLSLRRAIEESDFKDPDENKSNEFLLQVATIEKDYILNNYSAILERYYAMTKKRRESPKLEEK